MNGWSPHWPTVIVSIIAMFGMTFVKELATQLAQRIFKRKKDSDDDDVDTVDGLIADEAAGVDWHSVTEQEAMTFGLSMGLWRDCNHSCQLRRAAWGTATGGVISMSVIALACILCGTGPWFALSLVIGLQMVRALWLYLKAHQARQDVKMFEQQAHDLIRELAKAHPVKE